MWSFILDVIVFLVSLALTGYFGVRWGYKAGYQDCLHDAPGLAGGSCGNCGWEPPTTNVTQMMDDILEHLTSGECPGRRDA